MLKLVKLVYTHTLVEICANCICGHTHVSHGAPHFEFVTCMGVRVGDIRLLTHTLVGICADCIRGHTHGSHGAAQLEFVTNMYIYTCVY